MTADEVREIIATLERETKSRAARLRMAESAIIHGNVTDEGRDVWRDYAATFTGNR